MGWSEGLGQGKNIVSYVQVDGRDKNLGVISMQISEADLNTGLKTLQVTLDTLHYE